ncbi:hypothetical protein RI092_00635 [Lactococcus cremoris]|uniref:hypothetical protein n=1 Tax=Lactococcus lactis subsp. cremoris TaxID=1359 RepID=UPI002872029D|nr:hypothetical protein [Lactococcus cremoris]MDR9866330.1 hypothetical protein [Lactococcus cremoris]
MKKYYIGFNYKENNTAGAKAKEDANLIFDKYGFKKIKIAGKRLSANRYLNAIFTIISGYSKVLPLKQATFVENFPPNQLGESYVINKVNKTKKKNKSLNIILIHDLEELRDPNYQLQNNLLSQTASTKVLTEADCIISHNYKMKEWLIEKNIAASKIVNLEIFDYLHNGPLGKGGEFGNRVIIAGNLRKDKSAYLTKLAEVSDIKLELYGPGLSDELQNLQSIHYNGSYPSNQILTELSGSYGLVWDGDSVVGGVGLSGQYQKYNNPHKASLYLAAGFPVIMWKQAALASFIVENNLGFVVDNLEELPQKLSQISEQDYNEMVINVQKMGKKIRSGYFLSEALKKADKVLEENK